MAHALVIGIDGMIGAALGRELTARGWTVTGTSRRAGSPNLPLDLADPEAGNVSLPAADVAVICAAMARFSDCRDRPETARRVNVEAPAALAARLARTGTRVILSSTSAVFDGRDPFVPPERPVCPESAYGALKAEAEAAILRRKGAAVLRLTKVLHPGFPLFRNWAEALGRGEAIRAFSDLTLCPLLPAHVTAALAAIAETEGTGIFQVSGARDLSYLEAARILAGCLGADPALVRPDSARKAGIPPGERPAFTSLDSARMAGLCGFCPPAPEAVIAALAGEMMRP